MKFTASLFVERAKAPDQGAYAPGLRQLVVVVVDDTATSADGSPVSTSIKAVGLDPNQNGAIVFTVDVPISKLGVFLQVVIDGSAMPIDWMVPSLNRVTSDSAETPSPSPNPTGPKMVQFLKVYSSTLSNLKSVSEMADVESPSQALWAS
jgi:hypothetical protein